MFIIRRLNTLQTKPSTRGYVHKEAAATRPQQSHHSHPGPEHIQWNEIVVRSRNTDGVQLTDCVRDEFGSQQFLFFLYFLYFLFFIRKCFHKKTFFAFFFKLEGRGGKPKPQTTSLLPPPPSQTYNSPQTSN